MIIKMKLIWKIAGEKS